MDNDFEFTIDKDIVLDRYHRKREDVYRIENISPIDVHLLGEDADIMLLPGESFEISHYLLYKADHIQSLVFRGILGVTRVK